MPYLPTLHGRRSLRAAGAFPCFSFSPSKSRVSGLFVLPECYRIFASAAWGAAFMLSENISVEIVKFR